jgi:DNA-binding NarL/FixJ family response regulator
VNHIRIALIGMPPLFGDIVRVTLEKEADMAVVAEYDDLDEMGASHLSEQPLHTDVVIAGIPDGDDRSIAYKILEACPKTRVLTVSTHSGTTSVHELHPHTVSLGDVSPAALVDVIRQGRSNEAMWKAFLSGDVLSHSSEPAPL